MPDGTILEFPVGTEDATMKRVASEYWQQNGAQAQALDNARQRRAAVESARQRRAEAEGNGPWTKYQQQRTSTDGPWNKYGNQANHQDDSWWKDAPLADDPMQAARLEQARRELASRQSQAVAPPQIVGGVIMPPSVPASGQWDAQPAQAGAKDYIRQGSDMAGNALAAGAAGFSRGVTGLADLPGVAVGGMGNLAAGALERSGMVSPGVAQGLRDSFGMMPMGDGDLFRGTVADATGGASEYRGNNALSNYASTIGEFLPGALAPGATVGNALRYGVVPALASETAGQLTQGSPYEGLVRAGAAVAAAPLANLAERGVRRAISPYGGADAGRLELAQVLDDAGIPVSAGQRVGNESLRRGEGMSAAGQALNETQREALTQAALRTAGTDASRATPEVLADTARRIGSVFDDVARGVDITPEPGTVSALAAANETYKQLAPKSAQAPIVGQIVQRMTGAFRTGEAIPASTVNSWRSNLSKLTTSSDGATRAAAIEAITALDDAMASTLTGLGRGDDVTKLATAREQWRNFLAIQQAASAAGESAAVGILSPSSLRNAVVQQGRASYAQGNRGDLGTLARAAEGVIKPLPTSGTAENIRALGIPAMMWGGGGAAVGSAIGGGPLGAMMGSMAGMAAPAAAAAARMSRPMQGYLGNQLAGRGGNILQRNALSPVPAALSGIMLGQ